MSQTKVNVGMIDASSIADTKLLQGDGAWVTPAAGGAWNIIGTSVASSSASLTVTGLSSTYDVYAVHLTDLLPATDDVDLYIRLGDSSGVDSASSDYTYTGIGCESSSPGADPEGSDGATFILATIYANGVGNSTGEGAGCTFFLTGPGDGTMRSTVHGQTSFLTTNTTLRACWFSGNRNAVITHDRVNVLFSSGNITSGRMTVWGLAHA